MPPPRINPKWPSNVFIAGYCEPFRGRRVRFRYKQAQRVTEYLWHEDNRERCLRELDVWIESVKDGKPATTPAAHTVYTAFAAFGAAKLKKSSDQVRYLNKLALRHWFPDDMPLDAVAIERHLARRLIELETQPRTIHREGRTPRQAPPMTPAGIAQNASRINRFLTYCLRKGWLTSHPGEDLPRAEKKESVITYTDVDFARILGWFAERSDVIEAGDLVNGTAKAQRYRQYGLLWLFLAATGMRISEALALRWHDACDDPEHTPHISSREIHILGKGSKWRTFPLLGESPTVARVRLLVIALQRTRGTSGYVMPWRDRRNVTRQLKHALKSLGINGGNRPTHAMRATAEQIMQREHLDPLVMTRLLGHSLAVYEKHYATRVEAETLAEALGIERKT